MTKKITIFIVVFFIAFFAYPARATDTIDQQQVSSSLTTGSPYTSIYSQTFTPAHSNFKKWETVLYCSAGNYGSLILNWSLLDTGSLTIASGVTLSTCNSNTNINITFATSTPYFLNIGEVYEMKWNNTGTGQVKYIYGVSNPYSGGRAYGPDVSSGDDFLFNEYYDPAFEVISTLWSAEVIVPGPNYVYTGPNQSIIYKYSNFGGVYDEIWFKIYKLSGKNGTPVLSMASPHMNIASTTTKVIDGMILDYDPGYYQLYKAYFNGNEAQNFVSPVRNFQVIASTSLANASTSLSEILTQIEETVCEGIDTSSTWGAILCAVKRGALYMFKPDDASINTFIASYIELKQAFPFNAFFGITDALQAGVSTTTASTTATFKIPFITKAGHIEPLSVVSSSSLSNLIGTTNNNIFRTTIVYFAWLVAGFIIYFTVRRI